MNINVKNNTGAILGIMMVSAILILIGLNELTSLFRDPEPPPFVGDFVPDKHEVCSAFPVPSEGIKEAENTMRGLGWPEWPRNVLVDCENEHRQAPDGVARWHDCDSLRSVNGRLISPCSNGDVLGRTYARHGEDGNVIAVDFYISYEARDCTILHEMLHGKGHTILPEDDAKTKFVKGGHTEKPGHVLSDEGCGFGMMWLDRNEGGDWPY